MQCPTSINLGAPDLSEDSSGHRGYMHGITCPTPGHHQEAAQCCRLMVSISPGVGAQDRMCEVKGGRGLYSILVDIRPPDIPIFLLVNSEVSE